MTIAIKKMFAQILFWLYQLIDSIFEMFQVLCGIENVSVKEDGASKSLLNVFLESSAVTKAFFMILLVAVLVACFSTIVSVVKNIVNLKGGERKSHVRTLGQGFGSIIISLSMALIMIIFISLSGTVLNSVAKATSTTDGNVSFSNELFGMAVEKAYEYDYVTVYEPVLDENGNPKKDADGNEIMQIKKDANGDTVYEKRFKLDENNNPIYVTGWVNGKQEPIDFSTITPDELFGVKEKNMLDVEKDDSNYRQDPIVYLESFNFVTAYLAVIIMIIALVFSMLGLVKRIFDIVMLFITLPLISATIPLDDGARFKQWQDTLLSKVVLAYGAVLSVNVFLLIMPIINSLQLDRTWDSGFVQNLFKIFLMIGGALSINGGQLLLARLMGTSADESREMAHSARALLGGVSAVGGLMRGAKNLVFGGTNKYGRQRVGIMSWGARFGNYIGEKTGKDNYKKSFGGRMMRRFARLPKLQFQQPDTTMQNIDSNIRSIADVLTGGSGNNGSASGSQQYSPDGSSQAGANSANGINALVGNILSNSSSNGANGSAFTKPDNK